MLRNGKVRAGLLLAYAVHSLCAKIDEGNEQQHGQDHPCNCSPSRCNPLLGELAANYSEQQDQGRLPGAKVVAKLNLHVERKNEEGNQGGDEQVELQRSAPQKSDEE